MRSAGRTFLALGLGTLLCGAAPRGDVAIEDSGVFPESVTSSRDGTVFVGSLAKGIIYRAKAGDASATPWIGSEAAKSTRVMGLLADERHKLLWACTYQSATGTPKPDSSIQTFDLATGKPRDRYVFEGGGCNDLAIASDGTVYATDFGQGRILRLRRGEAAFTMWTAGPALASVDGIAFLADGALIVNTFNTGTLLRIPIGRDGAAGDVVPIRTSRPLVRPDGMRTLGGNRLLMVEGEGRLDEVAIAGDDATITPLREGIADGPTGVTLTRGTAFVSIGNFRAMRQPGAADVRTTVLAIPYGTGSRMAHGDR